ncbi:sensor of ECF-type sigma factor [uncultured Flavobacterium sp.]|uniref:sensor of ECF-type sigma factor n=1 Tax=uncultured Flavobacterium sp. TaxID=165435 RepID=UPI0030C7F9ED
MKKYITLLVVLFSMVSIAQPSKEKIEKVKALKVAYITKELSLTTAEAEKFWPIYNTYDEKQFELRHNKMKTIMKKYKGDGLDKLSDKEASTILSDMESIDEELVALKKKFTREAKEIIGAKKVLQLKKAEEEFTRTLFKQYKGKDKK